MIYQQFEDL